MKPARVRLLIGLLLLATGCAVKPIYDGVVYETFPDALNAQQRLFAKERPRLKAPGIHLDRSIRIVLPTRDYLKSHGLEGGTNEDFNNYLVDAGFANINTVPEVVRAAHIFSDVSVDYYSFPEKPRASKGEFILWLEIPDPKTLDWTLIAGPHNTEERLLTITGLEQGAERMNIWADDLAEKARNLDASS